MSWSGTLSFVDIGTGQWTLETDEGETVALFGDIPQSLSGKRVEVKGKKVKAHSFSMTGNPSVEVESVAEV